MSEEVLNLPSGLQIKVHDLRTTERGLAFQALIVSQPGVQSIGDSREEAIGKLVYAIDAMAKPIQNQVLAEARGYRRLRAIIVQDGFASGDYEYINDCRNIVFEE